MKPNSQMTLDKYFRQCVGIDISKDKFTAKIMLPAGGFLTSIIMGWFANRQMVREEFTNHGTVAESFFTAYLFSVRYIVPLFICS